MASPCCTASGLPESLHDEPGEAGEMKTAPSGLNYYRAKPARTENDREPPNGVVVVFSDVFGFDSARHLLVADEIAEKGNYLVLVPDVMHGKPIARKARGWGDVFAALPDSARQGLGYVRMLGSLFTYKWRNESPLRNDVEEVFGIAAKERAAAAGAENPSCASPPIAVLGFCFGGWLVSKVCSDKGLKTQFPSLKCGIGCHPSWTVENIFHWGRDMDVAKEILVPQLLLPAYDDDKKLKPGGEIVNILNRDGGPGCRSVVMKDVPHGFMSRGNSPIRSCEQEKIVAGQELAMKEFLAFLSEEMK